MVRKRRATQAAYDVETKYGEGPTVEPQTLVRKESEFGYTVEKEEDMTTARKATTTAEVEAQKEPENLPETRLAFSTQQLGAVSTIEDAAALFAEVTGTQPVFIGQTVLSDGFTHYDSKNPIKAKLVGVPLFLISWNFTEDEDGKYVFMHAVAQLQTGPHKLTFMDGGAGIYKQLAEFTQLTRQMGGLMVPRGLTESTYPTYEGKAINEKRAAQLRAAGEKVGTGTTYFLDKNN